MYYTQNLLIMTQITMSIRKPAGAIFLALALITTTFAGISSADHDEEHGFDWNWDNETGTVTIIPTPLLNTTTFSYEVHIDSSDSGTETWEALEIDIPTANVSLTSNLSDGYYMLSISVWNDYYYGYIDESICMGLNCSETQVDIIYDETTMVATLLVTGNVSNETITASLFDEWTGNEQVLYNVSNGDTIDIGGQGDGYFCLELLAETADGFEIDSDEICIQIGEEPVYPGMDVFYDTTMMMTVDLYDMPDNSTFHYFATIESWDTGFETWDNGTIDSNTTSIGFDIDEILSSNNQSYGNYWATMEIQDTEGNYVVDGGIDFCYGDQTDCEEVEDMFICDNGEEIPMSLYDDGYADCFDYSDEPNGSGSEHMFICDNGEEIPMNYYDDGYADCEDGSDEPNGTDDEDEEIEFVSHDMDIWFEQWDDESMEFVMVSRMVIDDSEAIALYAMMSDMFLGNDDGEVSQDEVDIFIEMMNEEMDDDDDEDDGMMQLDGVSGTIVDTWMKIEGLVGIDESNVNESEIVMIMVEVVAFDTTAYADSTTHIFTIEDDEDDDSSEDNMSDDEGCDVDSIWIHNSDTWSVSSITDSASTMAFTYEDFNNAWFTEDCPDDSGIVTFNLVKTDGGELPDATEDNDWEDLDTNRFPICAYAYAVMLPNGEFDVRVGIGAAPESGDYIIDLVDGAKYMISVVCSDPEGEDMTVTINNADLNLTSTYTSTATAEASLLLSVPAGYDGTYVFDVTWTDGYHVESGNLTIIGLGDGSTDDDISADGDGFLPGFTAVLGIVALLGAAMIGSRRNRA